MLRGRGRWSRGDDTAQGQDRPSASPGRALLGAPEVLLAAALPPAVVHRQQSLAQADGVGRDLHQLVGGDELDGRLQGHRRRRREAQGIVVSDTLPAEVALVDTTPPHGSAGQPGSLTWEWGTLALQEQAMLTIVVEVHPWVTTPFTNSVRVSSTSDVTPGNNCATEATVLQFPYSFYLPVTFRRKALQSPAFMG